ncbi:MAG: hypothetical protein H7175_08330 [Burkholderiales bacterium]|nr:hypothetical protein [Anaerolineae bacterium]
MAINLNNQKMVTLGLAFAAGLGLTLCIIALGIGVIDGEANTSAIGLLFVAGILLMVLGIIGWFAVVQPYKNFDDINVAQYHGHEHHHDDTNPDEPTEAPDPQSASDVVDVGHKGDPHGFGSAH